ncbi:MAG: hypothetical protein HY556_04035 [Euryarchaeota archaeon]|nr:hypothetical protein [Euryarchaeota archaeon]
MSVKKTRTNGITGTVVAITAGFILLATAIALGTFSAGGWGTVMGLMWFWFAIPLLVVLLLVAFFVDKVEQMSRRRSDERPGASLPSTKDHDDARVQEVPR